MSYLVLGIALLVGLVLLGRWFATAPPSQLVTALKWALGVLAALLGAFFLFTGKLSWALAPLGLLFAALGRQLARLLAQYAVFSGLGNVGGFGGGARSRARPRSGVETEFLRMTLDHDTGEMDGTVLQGTFAGRALSSMSLDELLRLLGECAGADPQSARVLEAYLDRVHGADWRERKAEQPRAGSSGMSKEEAYEILGLSPGATAEEIRAAHHRLMSKIHPDHGGSTYLAAKINQAKDVLLGG